MKKYTFGKEIQVEKVMLGELKAIRDRYMEIVNPYLRKLLDYGAISSNNFNKGWLIIQQKNYSMANHSNKGEVNKVFSVVISLMYSQDLLERHGIPIFLGSFKDETNATNMKYFIALDRDLRQFLEELNEKYKDSSQLTSNINPLPNGEFPTGINNNLDYGHPKYEILKKKVQEFFDNGGSKTIIFCEYRETVKFIYSMLLQLRPKVLPNADRSRRSSVAERSAGGDERLPVE